ncbi:hypothetical protein HNY73_007666 [Argiope bruennichi]|uniref:Uncharacterized protein n=1 Tax=Argiope bruennichi TaxID=94029 RepID=A0A8T0FJN9_ARGBR|nr:hypothetical protein HNY73_007666 [Argiope bruennichi]
MSTMKDPKCLLRAVVIFAVFYSVSGSCYFPIEYLGTYLIQTQAEGFGHAATTFSEITFESDAIPPWGKCFRRRGNNVILKDSTGGEDCMRCFHLTLKAPNIIQIHTEGLGKCYTKEEAVKATCPDDRAVHERKFKEIMLYRKQDLTSTLASDHTFCPISGKFRFTYTASNGEFRCDQTMSELSNCPDGNTLGVKFRQCSFPDMDINFRCLGDWEGTNNDRYLALMDLRGVGEGKPRFRCGMYRVDPLTGRVFVSLSADSTCYNQLRSATDGYESLILTPFPEKSPPGPVLHAHCRFPDWVQGQWEGMQVLRNVLIYKDHSRLQRLSLTCLRRENDTPEDRFIVFSSTHCCLHHFAHGVAFLLAEREYRCLGSWQEPGGVTFTYTQRREMDGFQCFSGKVLQGGKEAYIKEAGHSCIRGEDPLIYGMRITRHATCPDIGLSVSNRPRYPTIPPEGQEDPYYSPVPNDPYWYQKENEDDSSEKNRKSPTRSTKEEEHHNLASSMTGNIGSLLTMVVSTFFCWRWIRSCVIENV